MYIPPMSEQFCIPARSLPTTTPLFYRHFDEKENPIDKMHKALAVNELGVVVRLSRAVLFGFVMENWHRIGPSG